MTNEKAKNFANCLKNNYTIDFNDMADFCNTVIEALEIVEEFERAQIITGGRLNGRTYAYKCGLEDGKRKALEQPTRKVGKWIMPDKYYDKNIWRKCSVCNTHFEKYHKYVTFSGEVTYTEAIANYCKVCGAEMRDSENE